MIGLFLIINVLCLNSVSGKLIYGTALKEIKTAEELLMTGGGLTLSRRERHANDIIVKHKLTEIEKGIKNPGSFAPGLHFFRAKEFVERSLIFKYMKWLPKGAVLHGHSTALVSSEWIIKNITYHPNLLKCINADGLTIFTFKKDPTNHKCRNYVRVADEREEKFDTTAYDKQLEKSINLFTQNPEIEYPHVNAVWNKFQNMFVTLSDVAKYLPIFKLYYTRILEEAYEDGTMYLEIRTAFTDLYDDSGKIYTPLESIKFLQKINHDFATTNPDFLGFKIIYTIHRAVNSKTLLEKVAEFKELYAAYPDFIIGFDIVGQEDPGPMLDKFIDIIKSLPNSVKYFFHAGETNSYGTPVDYNLLTAILLNTTRIGHGYALVKHPVLWNSIKKKDIAIEISPISNQVLRLVYDLRNHPAAFYISENIPIVIANDDPGFWNAKGLSYDYYYAFMCFTPSEAGIKVLKQLVLNSIKYSVLTPKERTKAMQIFTRQWYKFLIKITSDDDEESIMSSFPFFG